MEPENSQSYLLESARILYFYLYESFPASLTIFNDDPF